MPPCMHNYTRMRSKDLAVIDIRRDIVIIVVACAAQCHGHVHVHDVVNIELNTSSPWPTATRVWLSIKLT